MYKKLAFKLDWCNQLVTPSLYPHSTALLCNLSYLPLLSYSFFYILINLTHKHLWLNPSPQHLYIVNMDQNCKWTGCKLRCFHFTSSNYTYIYKTCDNTKFKYFTFDQLHQLNNFWQLFFCPEYSLSFTHI